MNFKIDNFLKFFNGFSEYFLFPYKNEGIEIKKRTGFFFYVQISNAFLMMIFTVFFFLIFPRYYIMVLFYFLFELQIIISLFMLRTGKFRLAYNIYAFTFILSLSFYAIFIHRDIVMSSVYWVTTIFLFLIIANSIFCYEKSRNNLIMTVYSIIFVLILYLYRMYVYPKYDFRPIYLKDTIWCVITLIFFYFLSIITNKTTSNIINELKKENEKLESKVAERTNQLEEALNSKTNFFINIAHEIKTPLTLINNYLDMILKKLGKNGEMLVIKKNIENLNSIILNFMDAEKLEKGHMIYDHNRTTDLSTLLNDKTAIFEETARKKNITMSKRIEEGLIVKADPYSMDKVFNNLIYNAVRYNNTGGHIDIILESSDTKIIFIIEDTGIGIQNDDLVKIFELYYRISNEKKNIEGTGIGLYITKKIVESIGGSIVVESEPGKGSKFSVLLSKHIAPEEKPEAFSDYFIPAEETCIEIGKEEYLKGRKTVMIVEDNTQMLSYLYNVFKEKYNVFYSYNGIQAIHKFRTMKIKPDLILSDIMMDGMDGYELYDILSKDSEANHIPFIFLTALTSKENRMKSLKNGIIDYINKPFVIEELDYKIEAVLMNAERLKKNQMKFMEARIINSLHSEDEEISSISGFEERCRKFEITGREKEILSLILSGKENKEIASELNISINTIKVHSQNIYGKFGVHNRVELINIVYARDK
jgi:two-component system, sensor histidine kinase ChiS